MDDESSRVLTFDPNGPQRRALIRKLSKRAVPGNYFWRSVEDIQGYEGDYTPADHGMHWSDNR